MAIILVVDEEQDSATLLKRVLERDGHRVFTCSDYHEAVERASSLAPDLVVLEVRKSRHESLRLAAPLKKVRHGVKVLALTCCASAETGEHGIADDYLLRPVELDTIETKVRELLASKKQDEESEALMPDG
ncbi:MAG: response regulator [Desulfomonile tiedjei]|nr:response regulator [Desulfomonile tiedjei]